ncbi:MAG: hypothetical protein CM15mP72_0080 [Pelagibacteraceae bacterium]|nr:MAG: hypothetical protein CM15mP72_0080 [Pelagibacteraceae bacterium]
MNNYSSPQFLNEISKVKKIQKYFRRRSYSLKNYLDNIQLSPKKKRMLNF